MPVEGPARQVAPGREPRLQRGAAAPAGLGLAWPAVFRPAAPAPAPTPTEGPTRA